MRTIVMRAGRLAALSGVALLALPALARAAGPPAGEATITAGFSAGDSVETATARAKGKVIRVELAASGGKRLAKADAPSPGGQPRIVLRAGAIGSPGALLEVEASAGGTICRSIWRFRDGALARLPILENGKPLPDCEPAGAWSSRWDETGNAAARYVRERMGPTAQGSLHETRIFTFGGFELVLDPKRSVAEINGVAIPDWYEAELYVKSQLDSLFQRYALSGLARTPRLRFEADREAGVFALLFSDREGVLRLPVTGSKPLEKDEPGVELSAGDPPVRVAVTLARSTIPQDAVVHGAGPRFDGAYAPVIHWDPKEIRVYADAERELAAEALPGAWSAASNERILIEAIPDAGAVRFGTIEVALRLAGAPQGTDLLLLPRDGSPPTVALALRGPNSFQRVPVRCGETGPSGVPECRAEGEGQTFKRLGSALNVR
jgi:hypothetical protein